MAGELTKLVATVAAAVAAHYTEGALAAALDAWTPEVRAALLEETQAQIEEAVIRGLTQGLQAGTLETEVLLAA